MQGKYGMDNKLLDKAIRKAGNDTKLAEAYGCTKQNICNIKRGARAGQKFVQFCEEYVCTSQQ